MKARAWASGRACSAALLAVLSLPGPARAVADTSFDSGPELGARLLKNVVRIRALDLGEHGFGLVVGRSARHVYVVTARHVVARGPRPAARAAPDDDRAIQVSFCTGDEGGPPGRPATLVEAFDPGGHDLALLEVQRPAGYEPMLRALAAEAANELRQSVWLLGQEERCGVAPAQGAIESLRDGRHQLRVDFPSARGGVSGGPALSGHGVIGIVTDADDASLVVHGIASLQARLQAQSGAWWSLEDARNIPLTDPRSAEIDLAETLNRYLFGVRNLQQLLLQPFVPRPRFQAFADDYAAAINRFRDARERHDGTLTRHWPAPVFASWQALRDQLWQIHQPFWALNQGDSQTIFDQQRAPPELQARLRGLEPELQRLQTGISEFLDALARRRLP